MSLSLPHGSDAAPGGSFPLGAVEFAVLLDGLGPFGARPRLAVAVSGGPDSMALALLLRDWTGTRGGSLVALIVDHGLRPESGSEASLVAERLAALGIQATILAPAGVRPAAAHARAARHEALESWCLVHGVAHLFLAHHADDQAETVLIRAEAGSLERGLAGMARLRRVGRLRLLRPLLTIPKARLRATLVRAGIVWIEDPSNHNPRAARARARARLEADPDQAAEWRRIAASMGRQRGEVEARLAAALRGRVVFLRGGHAWLDANGWDEDALGAVLRAVSGADYGPDAAALARLSRLLATPGARGATLGGVRLLPASHPAPGWLAVRELHACAAPVVAQAGARWDRRFALRCVEGLAPGATLGALGPRRMPVRDRLMPAVARAALPAIREGGRVVAVPHLGLYDRPEIRIVLSARRVRIGHENLWPGRGDAGSEAAPYVGVAGRGDCAILHAMDMRSPLFARLPLWPGSASGL